VGLTTKKENSKGTILTRRIIRHGLGVAFWIHAVYVLGFFPLPASPVLDLPRYLFNTILVIFIINYSIFSENGWWSVTVDLVYIYFLPFIYLGKLLWWSSRLFYKDLKSRIVWQSPGLIYERVVPQPAAPKEEEKSSKEGDSESVVTGLAARVVRVFLKFALLWSLLILTVNWKPFLVLAIAVTFIGAAKAIWILWDIFSGGTGWVDKAETRLSAQIKALIEQINQWDESRDPESIKKAINGLKFHRSLYNFITDNTAILTKWAFTLSLVVSVPFYCYLCFLFSCVYFGIGKLVSLDLSFPNAFVDSLFMPFAWSALPANLLIRFIGGIQATCIAVMGYNILFRHLGSRLDKITAAASKLHNPFEEEMLRLRMQKVEESLAKVGTQRQISNGRSSALPKPRQSRRR
jgi:hypothetical protein